MQRVCFRLRVKRDRLEGYKARHRAVWTEMLDICSVLNGNTQLEPETECSITGRPVSWAAS